MFNFLKQLFRRKKQTPDFSASIEELWQTDFKKEKNRRFIAEKTDTYAALFGKEGLTLSLNKKNLFAWTVDPLYEYHDLVLEALIRFPDIQESSSVSEEKAGSCAFGFLLRYIETSYYSVLISDGGMVRMDAVFNGTPIPLLGWTKPAGPAIAAAEKDKSDPPPYECSNRVYSLRIIMRGTGITIIMNDRWTAYIEDDTIQSYGKIAFAGQNWGNQNTADGILAGIAVDSRRMEIEILHFRWNSYIRIPAAARTALAESLYATGRTVPALIELKKAWEQEKPDIPSLLLAGKMYMSQHLLKEAEEKITAVLKIVPDNSEAVHDYASLLYISNRTGELEDFLKAHEAQTDSSALLSNLQGHLDTLGRRWEDAVRHYGRAAALEPEQGLHFIHRAAAFEELGQKDKAEHARIEGARIFLSSENYAELAQLVPSLETAVSDEGAAIAGKYYYAAEEYDKALALFEKLTEQDTADSAVWYLEGIIYADRGKRKEAAASLRKAAEIEPEYGLYRLRLAENLFLAGEPCTGELNKALELNGENGWVWNLAVQEALARNNTEQAEVYALKARKLLPDETDILKNFAEVRRRQGRLDEVLEFFNTDAAAMHAAANLLVEEGRYEDADRWYLSALKLQSRNPDIMTDRAASCLEMNELNEADALLAQAMDIAPSPRIFQLIGYIAAKKGEYARCEVAYRHGLELFPDSADLLYDLSGLYLRTRRYDNARSTAKELALRESGKRLTALISEIQEATMRPISCRGCGQLWYVPIDLPVRKIPLRLVAQPPDDLPAGNCPSCGAAYCIACAKIHLSEDGRFRCPDCGKALKLADSGVAWLLSQWMENQDKEDMQADSDT